MKFNVLNTTAAAVRTDLSAESLKPGVWNAFTGFRVADGEPDTSEPVRDEYEHEDEKDQYSRSILDVVIKLASDAA